MLQNVFFQFSIIIISSLVLVKAASLLVTSASRIARHLKVSEYLISFLLVAFATSIPELGVGILAALGKSPSLVIGNILGSNIADLTIIIAIPAILRGKLSTNKLVRDKDLVFAVFFSILPILLMLDGLISRPDALILISAYLLYVFKSVKKENFLHTLLINHNGSGVLKQILIFILSVVLLLISSDFLVKASVNLGMLLNLPLIFIGLTIMALGTSLPELIFGIKAVSRHHDSEVSGNAVGSVIANATLILGIPALIYPIRVPLVSSLSSISFLILVLLTFFYFSRSNRNIEKTESLLLIGLYISFVIVEGFLR